MGINSRRMSRYSQVQDGLKKIFDIVDKDGSGAIDNQEAKAAVERMAKAIQELKGDGPSDEERDGMVNGIFGACDMDSDGKITFEELLTGMHQSMGAGDDCEAYWTDMSDGSFKELSTMVGT